ncbi:TadE family protein [Hyalangium sp.]|uniref:TadE family protein n=1 Tax=Hyalangium sp. TaxID=2028555 RepID=UPI002D290AFE|nr:TadE family protein [Hyalangium sp.]HYH96523.1 TadE family protein [Hyalangium sp.]
MGCTKSRSRGEAESGQAAIEAAIILPLFVFLILGTLQLGLMHQARLMTKYAAFRAVRAGSLHNARKDDMERAALAAVLPLLSEGRGGGEYIQPITRAEDFQRKWGAQGVSSNTMPDTKLPYVDVTLCGPTRREVSAGARELDFDDPRFAASDGWRASHRTKLRIQVTLHYRMPIPFANWVIHSIALQRELPWLMRMGRHERRPHGFDSRYEAAADKGVYILPIRAAYTMRMQSNLYTSELPEANACLTTNRY